MYCPSCGKENSFDQHFCRFCGFGLDKVSQLVLEDSHNTADPAAESKRSQRIMQKLASIGGYIFVSGGVILVALLLYTIIADFIIARGEILPGIAFLLLLIGAVLLLTYVIHTESQKDSAKQKKQQSSTISRTETKENLLLESKPEMISSVTDQTTERLVAGEVKNDKTAGS